MNQTGIRIVREDGLSTITIDRPEKANALTAGMMEALASAVAQAGDGDLILLQAAPSKAFCAGADIGEFSGGAQHLAAQEHALGELVRSMALTPAPILVSAGGRASGAGAMLLCLADVVVASPDLVLACPEIRFGMYPVVVDAVLQCKLTPAVSAQMCLSGRSLDARQAYEAGIVTDVVAGPDPERSRNERLAFYLERRAALRSARASRLLAQPPQGLLGRLGAVAPLLSKNFAAPGVRERILDYMRALRRPD